MDAWSVCFGVIALFSAAAVALGVAIARARRAAPRVVLGVELPPGRLSDADLAAFRAEWETAARRGS